MQGIRVEGLSFLEALLTGMTVCCAYACLCLLRRAVLASGLTSIRVRREGD